MPSPADGTGIAASNAALQDVAVSSALSSSTGATAVIASGRSTLERVRITATGDGALSVQGGQLAGDEATVTAHDLQISGSLVGVDVGQNDRFSATQSQIRGESNGIDSNGLVELDRVVVATHSPISTGIEQRGGTLGLEHVTVAHEGTSGGTDTALTLSATTANGAATLDGSALSGYARGIVRTAGTGHTFALSATNSIWDNTGDQLGSASTGLVHEAGTVHAAPALVDRAGGDLRPRGSSGQIDLDRATDPAVYADVQGTPASDGNGDGTVRSDAGALEYRHQPPVITTLDAPPGGNPGVSLAFRGAVADTDGDHVQVRWDFGDGATATSSPRPTAISRPAATRRRSWQETRPASPTGARSPSRSTEANRPGPLRATRRAAPAGALRKEARAPGAARGAQQNIAQALGPTASSSAGQRTRDDQDPRQPPQRPAHDPRSGDHPRGQDRQQRDRPRRRAPQARPAEAGPHRPEDQCQRRRRSPHPRHDAAADAAALSTRRALPSPQHIFDRGQTHANTSSHRVRAGDKRGQRVRPGLVRARTDGRALLDETIGENLRRTVERFGEREALVVAAPALPGDLPRAVAAGRPRGARSDRAAA